MSEPTDRSPEPVSGETTGEQQNKNKVDVEGDIKMREGLLRKVLDRIPFWRKITGERPDEVVKEISGVEGELFQPFVGEANGGLGSEVNEEPRPKNVLTTKTSGVQEKPKQDGVEPNIPEEKKFMAEQPAFPPAVYPELSPVSGVPTEQQIKESIDKYLNWRREHEQNEGVLEPGRAEILVHATSPEAATAALREGYLRSIFNLICAPGSRIDQMQGGKAKFVAMAARETIGADQELQQLILEKKHEIVENMPWIDASLPSDLDLAEDTEDLAAVLNSFVEQGRAAGYFGNVTRNALAQQGREWLYMVNLLPAEARRTIAGNSNAERFISTTLGHALEKYTPDVAGPSRQAAVVALDVGSYLDQNRSPGEILYTGGGTSNFVRLRERTQQWNQAVDELKARAARIGVSEFSEQRGALEVDINKPDPGGTVIDLTKEGVVLLPSSQRSRLEQSLGPGKSGKVIWFDDQVFASIDEAVGWLVTAPEGKSLYEKARKSGAF